MIKWQPWGRTTNLPSFPSPIPNMRSFLWLTFFVTLCVTTNAALPAWTPPLSTRGRYVVDANGNRFKLKSGAWHGASGTWTGSGDINDNANHHGTQNSHTLPLGLQYIPIDTILDKFEEYGINSIRFPFSNEMIHDTSIVQDDWVAANPQFKGLTPLKVYDAVIDALTKRGFAVILNNHTNKSKWCCGVADGNERWNESQSWDQWVADWIMMVQRYKMNQKVVGADLYNEVRRDITTDPAWGSGSGSDWWQASQQASDRILLEANPDILIIVEGINWVGIPVDGFAHSRPTLTPAGGVSHTLLNSNKLVYSAHFYGYTGPNHSGATGIGETSDPRYRDLSKADLYQAYRDEASFVALDTDVHYNAPLWMSEFGTSGRDPSDAEKNWFLNTLEYLTTNDLDFAVWPLVGFRGGAAPDGDFWPLLNWNLDSNKNDGLHDGNDWRAAPWDAMVNNAGKTGQVAEVTKWHMLNMDNTDFIQSVTQRARGDWDSGARKAMCPDGQRLIAMSNSQRRGLCTNANSGTYSWNDAKETTVVWTEEYVDTDWASGYTKYQCPADHYVVGYAFRGAKVSTIICAKASKSLSKASSTTVWFDQGDNRRENVGGDYAKGDYHGGCVRDEYIAGVAFTTRIGKQGKPDALLCRK
ncbi:glycoside hydrolase superfamily [Flagelloscypha sp. PMI_526]|nr:glycoside hydrolase superfamily [Flagelloscypha sp. PMI_526]